MGQHQANFIDHNGVNVIDNDKALYGKVYIACRWNVDLYRKLADSHVVNGRIENNSYAIKRRNKRNKKKMDRC